MNQVMYDVPSDPAIAKVRITAPCVTEGAAPRLERDETRRSRRKIGRAAPRPQHGGLPDAHAG